MYITPNPVLQDAPIDQKIKLQLEQLLERNQDCFAEDERLQHAFTKVVLDQLAANSADVKKHCRKLREQPNVALPAIKF